MDKILPRYKRNADAELMPPAAEKPELCLCQYVDNKLLLPTDVRQHFLSCPIFGLEWRKILSDFDRQWGSAADVVQPQPSGVKVEVAETEGKVSEPVTMPNEPTSLEDAKAKYGDPTADIPLADFPVAIVIFPAPCGLSSCKGGCGLAAHISTDDAWSRDMAGGRQSCEIRERQSRKGRAVPMESRLGACGHGGAFIFYLFYICLL